MPFERGRWRVEGDDPVDGSVLDPAETDVPDDAILVDLTADEDSMRWLDIGAGPVEPPLEEWDELTVNRELKRARKRLRDVRRGDVPDVDG